MRMSDEEYFRSCIAQERHLAQLRGCHNIEEFYENAGTLWADSQALPKWSRDWKACGPLIAEYRLAIAFCDKPDDPHGKTVRINQTLVHVADHPSPDHALRFAIVKAAIAHLEHERHRQAHPTHHTDAHQ